MGEPIEKHSWNRDLEFGLPDCRLKYDRDTKQALVHRTKLGRLWMEKVFCANCGCDGGAVTADWATHVFYLCDECALKHGKIEGVVEVPEQTVRGK